MRIHNSNTSSPAAKIERVKVQGYYLLCFIVVLFCSSDVDQPLYFIVRFLNCVVVHSNDKDEYPSGEAKSSNEGKGVAIMLASI